MCDSEESVLRGPGRTMLVGTWKHVKSSESPRKFVKCFISGVIKVFEMILLCFVQLPVP